MRVGAILLAILAISHAWQVHKINQHATTRLGFYMGWLACFACASCAGLSAILFRRASMPIAAYAILLLIGAISSSGFACFWNRFSFRAVVGLVTAALSIAMSLTNP